MTIGPLRRLVGAIGLVALVPLLVLVLLGSLSPVDAAQRGVVTVLVLLVLGRGVSWGLRVLAAEVDAAGGEDASAHEHL